MAKIPFNVDANTARLIGRENVSKSDGAIIEIIKNAYDADATLCALYYDADNQRLWIVDNGCGMDEDIVKKHWMSIGFSDKDVELKSEKGRIKTGAKGIGRFALDRLGADCTMYTYNGGNHIVWHVNWEQFVRGVNINDVYADLENSNFVESGLFEKIGNNDFKNLVMNSFKTGTVFEISELRDTWDETFFKRLKNNLSSLIPPSLSNSFKVYLYNKETTTDEARIVSELLTSYDYAVDFDVSKNGDVKISVFRNEVEFGAKFDYIINNAGFDDNDKGYFNGEPIVFNKNVKDLHVGITEDTPYGLGAFSGKICFYKIVIVNILSYLETDRQSVMRKLSDLWDKDNQSQKAENDIIELVILMMKIENTTTIELTLSIMISNWSKYPTLKQKHN